MNYTYVWWVNRQLPATRPDDYQKTQEDTVSILLSFITIKGKKSTSHGSAKMPRLGCLWFDVTESRPYG